MTFWASGSSDKTPNNNTVNQFSTLSPSSVLPHFLPPFLLPPLVTVRPRASENDRLSGEPLCAVDEEVLFAGDGPVVCVCVCAEECEGCVGLGAPSTA